MKIRVEYTYEIAGEDLDSLNRYHKGKLRRENIRQLLIDEGQGGVEEQINQGRTWNAHDSEVTQ